MKRQNWENSRGRRYSARKGVPPILDLPKAVYRVEKGWATPSGPFGPTGPTRWTDWTVRNTDSEDQLNAVELCQALGGRKKIQTGNTESIPTIGTVLNNFLPHVTIKRSSTVLFVYFTLQEHLLNAPPAIPCPINLMTGYHNYESPRLH